MDEDDENAFGTGGFQMMGLMNAFKTGDMHTDMIIALCLPFILKLLFKWIEKLEEMCDWKILSRWWATEPPCYERFISHNTTRNSWGGTFDCDEDTKNAVLLKAIKMYLHQVVKLNLRSAHLDLTQLKENSGGYGYYDCDSDDDDDANDDGYRSKKTFVGMLSRYEIINRVPNNEWHNLGTYGTPPSQVRLRIEIRTRNDGDEEKKTSKFEINETVFHFTSLEDGSIDAFIDTAYKWYIEALRKLEDNSRYLYEMKLPEVSLTTSDDENKSSDGISYKRYRLSNEKSFDSLFFREKKNLLALIDHFSKKTGKYAIQGYPHKLGVLLYGPPGSGKTSLIKALAQYTGRSIVNVPLSRISTNSELMSVFFDKTYKVEGASVPIKLNFKDVIYVMEDVDAASKIVKRRDGKRATNMDELAQIKLPVPKSLWRLLLESTSDDCKTLVKELTEKSERLKRNKEMQEADILRSLNRRLSNLPGLGLVGAGGDDRTVSQICNNAIESATKLQSEYTKLDEVLASHAKSIKSLLDSGACVNDIFINDLLGEVATMTRDSLYHSSTSDVSSEDQLPLCSILDTPTEKSNSTTKSSGIGPSLFRPKPDQLSLSGLLNVLDGVVDTPGRIVIMTTNHPEMLDPALIRPGRVDKKLLLGYMSSVDIIYMLEHYFQTTLDTLQRDRVTCIIDGQMNDNPEQNPMLKMTPAQVEQLSAEFEEVEDMIGELEKMSPLHPSKSRPPLFTSVSKAGIDRHRSR